MVTINAGDWCYGARWAFLLIHLTPVVPKRPVHLKLGAFGISIPPKLLRPGPTYPRAGPFYAQRLEDRLGANSPTAAMPSAHLGHLAYLENQGRVVKIGSGRDAEWAAHIGLTVLQSMIRQSGLSKKLFLK